MNALELAQVSVSGIVAIVAYWLMIVAPELRRSRLEAERDDD